MASQPEPSHLSRPRLLEGTAAPQPHAGQHREPGRLPARPARPVPSAPASPSLEDDKANPPGTDASTSPGTEHPDPHATTTPRADPRSCTDRQLGARLSRGFPHRRQSRPWPPWQRRRRIFYASSALAW